MYILEYSTALNSFSLVQSWDVPRFCALATDQFAVVWMSYVAMRCYVIVYDGAWLCMLL